jgi:hypothetical protein
MPHAGAAMHAAVRIAGMSDRPARSDVGPAAVSRSPSTLSADKPCIAGIEEAVYQDGVGATNGGFPEHRP